MPTQAVHVLVREEVRQHQLIGLHDGDRRDKEHVASGASEGLVGGSSLDGRGCVTQRGTFLRGIFDQICRGVPVPL